MNTFKDAPEFFKNSLREILEGAKLSVSFVKANSKKWSEIDPKEQANPGVLGIPACILYACFIDAVGAMWLKQNGKTARENFNVLNSPYFDLNLKKAEIDAVHDDFRSLLVHNALIQRHIDIKTDNGLPFDFRRDGNKVRIRIVRLGGLKTHCERALEVIIKENPSTESFPASISIQNVVEPVTRSPTTTAFPENIVTRTVRK
jgi:hypothetical protein